MCHLFQLRLNWSGKLLFRVGPAKKNRPGKQKTTPPWAHKLARASNSATCVLFDDLIAKCYADRSATLNYLLNRRST
jgi:hypothetical protein